MVVGTLDERTAHAEHGFAARLGNSRRQGHGMLFGDADIDKLSARSLSALRRPVPNAGRSCRDGADGRVLLHPLQQMRGRQFVVGFGGRGVEQFAGDLVEGCTPVPALLVLLGRCIALALPRDHMEQNRLFARLDQLEHILQPRKVVSVYGAVVCKAHLLKER